MMTALRILIADDHELVRRGLRSLLETQPGWEVVAEAANGKEAVQKATELQPEIVVLDLNMPELDGLKAARQIHQILPDAELLIVTVYNSSEMVQEALRIGVRGYVLKSDAGRDLVLAITAVSQHKHYFSSRLTGYSQQQVSHS
jgi:DNA-binding NarL/FixJ family response regulator